METFEQRPAEDEAVSLQVLGKRVSGQGDRSSKTGMETREQGEKSGAGWWVVLRTLPSWSCLVDPSLERLRWLRPKV